MKSKRIYIAAVALFLIFAIFIAGYEKENICKYFNKMKTYSNNEYSISLPKAWDIKEVNKNIALFYLDNNEIGSVEVYSDCSYCSSVSSFTANIFGMHSKVKEKQEMETENGQKIWKLLVETESSAAEQEAGNSEVEEELYFLWTNNKDKAILISLKQEEINEEDMDKITNSFAVAAITNVIALF